MKRPKIVLSPKSFKVDRRAHFFLFLVMVVFTILVFRLWTIQVYRQEDYARLSRGNITRPVPVQSVRGDIQDRNGKVLAKDINYRDVWISMNFVNNRRAVTPEVQKSLELLSEILGRPYARLETDYLTKKRDPYNKHWEVCVATRIPPHQYVALEERLIEFPEKAMVFARKVPSRYYHYHSLASHILGHTGPINAREITLPEYADYAPYSLIGKNGIEKQYESFLHGTDGLNQIIVDTNEIQRGPTLEIEPASPGNHVILNIDYNYQYAAEKILGGSPGVIIVSTPQNTILAMASNPRYDINEYNNKWNAYNSDPYKPFLHRAIAGKYEPGSVFKIFEAFALLEELKISPEQTVFCPGFFTLKGDRWKCHWKPGHGHVDLYDAIRRSCNVYFYSMVGTRLNIPDGRRLREWAQKFGFESRTGVDLPDEPPSAPFPSKVTMKNPRNRYSLGVGISNAIGQGGVVFSPLQVNTALCAIANGGTLYKPQIAQKITSYDGQLIKPFEPTAFGTIDASTKTFEIVRKAMWEVVNNNGTGRQLKVYNDFIVAGKTGTAQSNIRGKDHAWFVCYGPFEKPEIVITVMIEYAGHGGDVAAPMAKKILDVYLGHVNLEDLV